MSDTARNGPLLIAWWKDRLLIAAGVTFALWSVLSLTWPLSGDAGVFSWMADTVYRGGAPYVDSWDTKGPSSWLPSLLMQLIVGRTAWGIRIFDIASVVAAVAAMRSISIALALSGSGRIAISLYLLWYASLDFWTSAQPDGWVAAWLIMAVALALGRSRLGPAGAGILVGLAAMQKPFYVGYIVVVWMVVAISPGGIGRAVVTRSLLAAVGLLTAVGLQLLFLNASGGLNGYWDVQRWNIDVYAQLDTRWLTRIPSTVRGMFTLPWGVVTPMALFGVVQLARRQPRATLALGVGLAGAVLGVMLQGKGWLYHWLPMLPFLALLADVGFGSLLAERADDPARQLRRMTLIIALVVAALAPVQQLYRFVSSRGSRASVETYERREFRYYGRYAGSAYAIVDSLARIEPRSARILLWAMHPAPQFLAGLPQPTRFAVLRPLYDGAGSAYRARYRAQFDSALRMRPPRWWLVPTKKQVNREPELKEFEIEGFPAAHDYLKKHYRAVSQSEDWLIYERVATAAARSEGTIPAH